MSRRRKRIIKWIAITGLILFNPVTLMCSWFGYGTWRNNHPRTGVHLEYVDWLPDTATNISFYLMYSWKAYEFEMSESDFKDWAQSRKWSLSPIESPRKIHRYSWWTAQRELRELKLDGSTYSNRLAHHIAEVNSGYYYEKKHSGGGYAHVVFDRESGTVYVEQ